MTTNGEGSGCDGAFGKEIAKQDKDNSTTNKAPRDGVASARRFAPTWNASDLWSTILFIDKLAVNLDQDQDELVLVLPGAGILCLRLENCPRISRLAEKTCHTPAMLELGAMLAHVFGGAFRVVPADEVA